MQQHITDPDIIRLNGYLEAIAAINSFVNDNKTYYISLLDKINGSYEDALRKHLSVKEWTFTLQTPDAVWEEVLKEELLFYFGQYILQAKKPMLSKEHEGLPHQEVQQRSRALLQRGDTDVRDLIEPVVEGIKFLLPDQFVFYKLNVNWHDSHEGFYELYVNDYLFDFGNQILFLHFGSCD